jgi:monoamine oxidase
MSSVNVTLLAAIVVLCVLAAVVSASTIQRKIIVVGSGPAGTSAARSLLDRGIEVTVLEGHSRVCGPLWTDSSSGVKLDLGASWIHGSLGTTTRSRY